MASPLTLRALGEDAVVKGLVNLLPTGGDDVLRGPGDDCAAVRIPGSLQVQLLKADSVVEGIHFESHEDMERVGWKAVCRAISDIAAMGGIPQHALITIAADPNVPWVRLEGLYAGVAKAARHYNVSVVGGETGRTSGPLVCSVFLTGVVTERDLVSRGGGRPGDVLFVTGLLGGSLASGKHLDFAPRLKEGQWLAEHHFPSAMMDLSDGLAADAPRLARESRCGLEIEPDKLPHTPGCSWQQAMCDGEDFELLFAVPSERVESLKREWEKAFPKVPLTKVGCLSEPERGYSPREIFTKGGYDHFQ